MLKYMQNISLPAIAFYSNIIPFIQYQKSDTIKLWKLMAFYRLSLKKNLYLCANKRVNKKM